MKEPKGRTLRTGVLQSNGRLCCDRREMRQEKPASHKAADQREMRHTTTAQEAGSERTEGEKGGGYFIEKRDGLILEIRDKSNLQTRDQLEQHGVLWRVIDFM